MTPPIRVLIADDETISRLGVAALLRSDEGLEIAGEAEDGRQCLELAERLRPDVVLMDLAMPELNGVEATRRLTERGPRPAVVLLTGSLVEADILDALRAGALGYLSKRAGAGEIGRAIRRVHQGEPALPASLTRKLLDSRGGRSHTLPEDLTERELEVLKLVACGLGNLEVGERLAVSETTVRSHVHNVLTKLALSNRVQLVLYALREGWVSLEDATGELDS